MRAFREGMGATMLVSAMAVLAYAIMRLTEHDYVGAVVLVVVGISVLGASVELLRPWAGE